MLCLQSIQWQLFNLSNMQSLHMGGGIHSWGGNACKIILHSIYSNSVKKGCTTHNLTIFKWWVLFLQTWLWKPSDDSTAITMVWDKYHYQKFWLSYYEYSFWILVSFLQHTDSKDESALSPLNRKCTDKNCDDLQLNFGVWYCQPMQGWEMEKNVWKLLSCLASPQPDIFSFFVHEFSSNVSINHFTYTATCNRMIRSNERHEVKNHIIFNLLLQSLFAGTEEKHEKPSPNGNSPSQIRIEVPKHYPLQSKLCPWPWNSQFQGFISEHTATNLHKSKISQGLLTTSSMWSSGLIFLSNVRFSLLTTKFR